MQQSLTELVAHLAADVATCRVDKHDQLIMKYSAWPIQLEEFIFRGAIINHVELVRAITIIYVNKDLNIFTVYYAASGYIGRTVYHQLAKCAESNAAPINYTLILKMLNSMTLPLPRGSIAMPRAKDLMYKDISQIQVYDLPRTRANTNKVITSFMTDITYAGLLPDMFIRYLYPVPNI